MLKIIITLVIIAIGIAFMLWDSFSPAPKSTHVSSAPLSSSSASSSNIKNNLKPAPDISFKSIDGKNYTLKQFEGKTIILNFWATWCTPCIIEFPQLLDLAEEEQDELIFIALSVDENVDIVTNMFSRASKDFQEKLQQDNVIIGMDSDKSISKGLFGTVKYPESYIITPDLKIKHKIKGARNWLNLETKRMLYNN